MLLKSRRNSRHFLWQKRNDHKKRSKCFYNNFKIEQNSNFLLIILICLILNIQNGFAQYSDDPYIVEPTPALRLNEEDFDGGTIQTKYLQQQQKKSNHNHIIISTIVNDIISTTPTNLNILNENGRFFNFGSFHINPTTTKTTITNQQSTQTPINYYNDIIDETNLDDINATDEARYNLATRIMSNGVGVIVASDKNNFLTNNINNNNINKHSVLRILPSNLYKPLTLAPSTLNEQIMMMSSKGSSNSDNFTIPINPNQFVTKTCLTTYTYRTTYLQDGKTTIESREKVISNIATEERNYLKITPTAASSDVTLSRVSVPLTNKKKN